MRWFLFLLVACGDAKQDSGKGTPAAVDTAPESPPTETGEPIDSGEPSAPSFTIEEVGSGAVAELSGVRDVLVHPTHGETYILGETGTIVRTLSSAWVNPEGSYCLGGSLDEEGVCRGGTSWSSGRIISPQATLRMCTDAVNDELILIKAGGARLEVIDVGREGPEPYSFNRVVRPARSKYLAIVCGPSHSIAFPIVCGPSHAIGALE